MRLKRPKEQFYLNPIVISELFKITNVCKGFE